MLGGLGGQDGASEGQVGEMWGQDGASEGRVAEMLGPKWRPSGQHDRCNNRSFLLMPFGIDFWTNFGRLGLPKWSQVGTKIGSKIDVNFDWRFFKNHCFS